MTRPSNSETVRVPPPPGTERYTLRTRSERDLVITREVWTDVGQTHFWDEVARDFVTWEGSWARVEAIEGFTSREAARLFMVDRDREATDAVA